MNVVLIVADTFRADHLGCYGNPGIHTPNLDRLAAESLVFDQAHCCSFPTLPCRAELFTGRFVFPYLNWGPLPADAVLLSDTFASAGYTCTMVTDNLPLCRSGYGYDRGFHSRLRIRGQWYDNFQPEDRPFTWPCPPEKMGGRGGDRVAQYLRNTSIRETEEDCFAPQVVNQAIGWLEQYHDKAPFYLHVDIFDPHEPWDAPQHYVDRYDPVRSGDDIIYPAFGGAHNYEPGDLKRMRALYAAEVTMVDHWVGKLLAKLDELGRREDTAVVFMSDHGIFLGERGLVGKMGGKSSSLMGWPTYTELAHVPMMFRVPGVSPGRSSAFVHPGDVGPTLLDAAGITVPKSMTAASLKGVLERRQERVRDVAVSSWSLKDWSAFRPSVVRSEEWSLVFWRSGIEPELYHRPSDPGETQNVYQKHRSAAKELHRAYLEFLRASATPARNYIPRLWLMSWGKQKGQSLLMPDKKS